MIDASQLPSRIGPDGTSRLGLGAATEHGPRFIGPPPGRARGTRRTTSKLSMRPSFYRALDGPCRGLVTRLRFMSCRIGHDDSGDRVPHVWHRTLENARFCHGCGSPITESSTHAEYKQVTVLFADVVHSMDIAAAVGAERLREIMAELVDRAAAVVQRYGGTVDKFTGDGIMAVFGAPIALEDHAIRACLAALGIQEEAKRLAVDVQRPRRCRAAAAGGPELRSGDRR